MERRKLKGRVLECLDLNDIDLTIEALSHLPVLKTINALFSFLYSQNERIKWAAVTSMGHLVAQLADRDRESARVIVRRLMWNLNDESGGIGWGSPEAMGEILASHGGLAREYAKILVSYTRTDGNYLEHPLLQRGLVWGIGRLAETRPQLLNDAGPHLMQYLKSPDASLRGHCARVMGLLAWKASRPLLVPLLKDDAVVQIYINRKLSIKRVKDLAKEALSRISSNGDI